MAEECLGNETSPPLVLLEGRPCMTQILWGSGT